jgi:hypothetical protein
MRATLRAILTYSLLAITGAVADECKPNHVDFDVCAFAREVQTKTAPSLPIKMSANVTFVNILAIGPLLSMGVQWSFTSAQIDALILASQKTPDQFYAAMDEYNKNAMYSSPDTAAFVRLGGRRNYARSGKRFRTNGRTSTLSAVFCLGGGIGDPGS